MPMGKVIEPAFLALESAKGLISGPLMPRAALPGWANKLTMQLSIPFIVPDQPHDEHFRSLTARSISREELLIALFVAT